MRRILVVGHTPPPFHGQAIMIAEMLRLRDPGLELSLVRMNFSADNDDLGRVRPMKFLRLATVIADIWRARFKYRPDILYYPPSGPKFVAVSRDIVLLLSTRWLFPKTVFHFHAGGISEFYPSLPWWLKPFFRLAFYGPDAAIRLSELNPEDGKALHSKTEHVIPYGIADLLPPGRALAQMEPGKPVGILFVGIVSESKGVTCLIQACGTLAAQGRDFRVELMGRFESPGFERSTLDLVRKLGLESRVRFLGPLTGEAKTEAFLRAGIFCLPSFYESETFGVVLVEAMCFGLPVVSTRWRGIPSVVAEGETGFLAPVRDSDSVAERLSRLLEDPGMRARFGAAGRARFERLFRIEEFHRRMTRLFLEL